MSVIDVAHLERECEALKLFYKQELVHPFPYKEAFAVMKMDAERFAPLIPDIDLYESEIAGYCSWGKHMLSWDTVQKASARQVCDHSFFEKNPQYDALRENISSFPALRREFELYDEARGRIIEILTKCEEMTR